MSYAAGQFRHFGDKDLILIAPIEDDFVLLHYSSHETPVFSKKTGVYASQAVSIGPKSLLTIDGDRTFAVEGGEIRLKVTLSGAIAGYPADGETKTELLRRADEALYRAKQEGRNRLCIAREEKMVTKTSHYTASQLERLSRLAKNEGVGEAALLREALDDLLRKYEDTRWIP